MRKYRDDFLDQDFDTLARVDPAQIYDSTYYKEGYEAGSEHCYGRQEPWLSFFKNIAQEIDNRFKPKSVADVGCAFGLLSEALLDREIDVRGFDVSPYAISQARADVAERLSVHNILEPIPSISGEKYDVAVCIEVLEHIPADLVDGAIENLCACSDRIVFSSSPDDFEEPTHLCVLPTGDWIKKFEQFGFYPDRSNHVAAYIAPHARVMVKRRRPLSHVISNLLGRV